MVLLGTICCIHVGGELLQLMLRQMYVIMVKVLVFVGVGEESSRVKSVSHLGMFLRAELFSTQRRIVLKTAVQICHVWTL